MTKVKKECPLCGKSIENNDTLCNDCRNSADNQYRSDFFYETNTEYLDNNSFPTIESNSILKKRKSRAILLFVSICILVTIFGILASLYVGYLRENHVAEDRYWEQSLSTNTSLAYAKYLVAYPQGKYVNQANDHIQQLKDDVYLQWDRVRQTGDIKEIFLYIKDNPNSIYIDSAKYLADSISWQNALSLNTLDAISTYLSSIKLAVIPGIYKILAEDRYNYLSTIRQVDPILMKQIKVFINSFYSNLKKKDTTSLKEIFESNFILNNDVVSSIDLLQFLINRDSNKDSIMVFSADTSSFNATIDRDSLIFLNYIEKKDVRPKFFKKNQKQKIEKIYEDSIFMTINRLKTISSILFKMD